MGSLQLGEDFDDEQVAEILALLGSLEGPFPQIVMPRLPSWAGHLLLPAVDPTPDSVGESGQ